jgi:hypothetical protein
LLSIAIKPSKANRVRALAAANPELDPLALSKKTGVDRGEVRAALTRKQGRRKKRALVE